jgi:hypothetical protein
MVPKPEATLEPRLRRKPRMVGTDSKLFLAVQQQRDWTLVDERYLHHRLELSGGDFESSIAQRSNHVFVQRLRNLRGRCSVKRRPPSLPAIARQRELGNHEDASADVLHRPIHVVRGIGRILEETKIADLVGDVLYITGAVFSLHTEQNHEPAADLPDGRAIDRNSGRRHTLYDGSHSCSSWLPGR